MHNRIIPCLESLYIFSKLRWILDLSVPFPTDLSVRLLVQTNSTYSFIHQYEWWWWFCKINVWWCECICLNWNNKFVKVCMVTIPWRFGVSPCKSCSRCSPCFGCLKDYPRKVNRKSTKKSMYGLKIIFSSNSLSWLL